MSSKRRRIALSCINCRRRKVKCDRITPACIRCQKGGIADQCLYVPYKGDEAQSSATLEGRGLFGRVVREGSNESWVDEAEDYVQMSSRGHQAGFAKGSSRRSQASKHRWRLPVATLCSCSNHWAYPPPQAVHQLNNSVWVKRP